MGIQTILSGAYPSFLQGVGGPILPKNSNLRHSITQAFKAHVHITLWKEKCQLCKIAPTSRFQIEIACSFLKFLYEFCLSLIFFEKGGFRALTWIHPSKIVTNKPHS